MARPRLVVVKVGSSTLVDAAGALDRDYIRSLCDQVARLVSLGTRVVIVSSGAAAAGRETLGFSDRPEDLAGAIEAADQINKYFQINCQPLVSSSYWNIAYGRTPGEAEGDGEGLHTMRVLGRNMAWMLKCIEAGRAAGINAPGMEPKVMTNVVREDLLGE